MPGHSLDIDPLPTVSPIGAPGGDIERIQANPDMFGGSIARALQGFGGAVEKASNTGFEVLDQQQQLHSRINVDDQVNKFISARDTLLRGDPSKTIMGPNGPQPDTGYLGLEGRQAPDKRADTLQALEEWRLAGRNNLRSPYEKLAYDLQTRRMYSEAENNISSHADSQWKNWAAGVSGAGANHDLNAFVNAIGNPDEMKLHAENYVKFKVQQATLKFGSDPNIEAEAEANAKRDLLKAQTDAVAVHDPARALKILESNRKTAGVLYDDMYNHLRARAESQTAGQIATRAIAGARSGTFSAPVNDAISRAAASAGVNPLTLTRLVQIESGGNPHAATGSYKGLGQLSTTEFHRYGGGDIWNPYDNARAAANKMHAEGQAFAEHFGHQPTPFDSYMIHQQGLGGYAAHLSRPDAPAWMNMASTGEGQEKGTGWAKKAIWGNIPDRYKAIFGSVNNVTSRDFLAMWQQKFGQGGGAVSLPAPSQSTALGMSPQLPAIQPAQYTFPPEETIFGGQGRGALEVGAFPVPNVAAAIRPNAVQNVLDDPEAQQSPKIMREALSDTAMMLNAQEIAENQNKKAKDELNDVAANEHITAIADAAHTPGVDMVALYGRIAHDGRLKWETKSRLLDRVAKYSGEEERIGYGPGFLEAYKRILSASGAPGHISKIEDILNLPVDAVTMRGQKELINTLKMLTKEDSVAAGEAEMKKIFLDSARRQVSGEGIVPGMKDPRGEEIFLRFLGYFMPAYDKARTEGKTPAQLLDPESKDYLGKDLSTMKRPMNEWYADALRDNAPTAAPAASAARAKPVFNPADVKTPDQLKAAVAAGTIDRATGIQIGLQRGWLRENPVTPPPTANQSPQIPISR